MAHKTITISEEAYEALTEVKAVKESDVILRIVKNRQEGTILDYAKSIEPDEEFARALDVAEERDRISVTGPRF